MIGQHKNLMILESWKRTNNFPRFIVIIGELGSGRYTLSKEITKHLEAKEILLDKSVADIRDVITNSYKLKDKFCYIIRDIDEMSINAKNSILKVVEEPPNEAYFIMTLKDKYLIPDTIMSRAFCLNMQPYSLDQLKNFVDDEMIIKYCNTPGKCLTTDRDICKSISSLAIDIILILETGKGSDLIKKFRGFDKYFNYDLFWNIFNKELLNSSISIKKAYIKNLSSNIDLFIKNKSISSKMCIETFILNMYRDIKAMEVQDGTN